jgi:hypothetical protein
VAAVMLAVGLLGSAGWLTYGALAADQKPVQSQAAPKPNGNKAKPDNKNNEPKKVPLELEKALAKAAGATYKAYSHEVDVGKTLPNEVMCKWSARWLNAELVLSNKKTDQLASYTAHRDRLKELEKLAKTQFDRGQIGDKDYWPVKYFLVEAEIWLARAKSGK